MGHLVSAYVRMSRENILPLIKMQGRIGIFCGEVERVLDKSTNDLRWSGDLTALPSAVSGFFPNLRHLMGLSSWHLRPAIRQLLLVCRHLIRGQT